MNPKPKIDNLSQFEKNGVEYMVKEPDVFLGKFILAVVTCLGDWAIYLLKKQHFCGSSIEVILLEPIKTRLKRLINPKRREIDFYTHVVVAGLNGKDAYSN